MPANMAVAGTAVAYPSHGMPDIMRSEGPMINEVGHRWAHALRSGLVGAATLTVIHESVRRLRPDAPRMDMLGRRAISRGMAVVGAEPPDEDRFQAAAGLEAVVLPPLMGLGHRPSARTKRTAVMTFCWYLVGGLAAAVTYRRLASRNGHLVRA
jgi:hypothetical protein